MSERTRAGKIGSIKINEEFIKKLGLILESEISIRSLILEKEIDQAIEKERSELASSRFLYETDEEKERVLLRRSENIRDIKKLHVTIQYTIESTEETLSFNLADELLKTNFLPDKGTKEKIDIPNIDVRGYAKYILKEGCDVEKRELLECLKSKISLANKKISLVDKMVS